MKTIKKHIFITLLCVFLLQSCSKKLHQQSLSIHNSLNFERNFETVSIRKSELNNDLQNHFENLEITDLETNNIISIQYIDKNNDGIKDVILFQPELAANQTKKLSISTISKKNNQNIKDTIAFSRFVPERLDDFAWENDKVAFRTFGPKSRKITEQGIKGGAISSGIDCWLKRVDYPIINKWYKKHINQTGNYHKDTGEGVDNYHVGASLGCGGIGVFKDSTLFTSKNFNSYLEQESGAIQTRFKLIYNNWNTGSEVVSEVKEISLNKGSHLTRFELVFNKDIKELVTGFPIEKQNNGLKANPNEGWFSLWRPHEDSELGLAIVINPKYITNYFKYYSNEKDKSHLFIQLKPINNRVVYYAGYGWKKSKAFTIQEDWNNYVKNFSMQINTPIKLTINTK